MSEDREERAKERATLARRIAPVFNQVVARYRDEFGESCGVNGNARRLQHELEREIRISLGLLVSVEAVAISLMPGPSTWASICVQIDDCLNNLSITEGAVPEEEN
jgi:hypothetical protein